MAPTFDDLLAQNRIIFHDGATGTLLQQFGLPLGQAPESWVVENPAAVFAAAEAYVNAGADIILTCTFGGTAARLRDAGLESKAFDTLRVSARRSWRKRRRKNACWLQVRWVRWGDYR
jgi:5-methyltetrahydrofolate--homocysteine methyltransferase